MAKKSKSRRKPRQPSNDPSMDGSEGDSGGSDHEGSIQASKKQSIKKVWWTGVVANQNWDPPRVPIFEGLEDLKILQDVEDWWEAPSNLRDMMLFSVDSFNSDSAEYHLNASRMTKEELSEYALLATELRNSVLERAS